ncbi:MAG: LPS export ABC transporter permease LptG [Deltaproteobacteria bacterium]|nr:LPS export ABC transporter permease LptG [Deltaproteobacteria bacterium]
MSAKPSFATPSFLPLISAYLRREFLRFFFLCLALFLGLSLLVDFFDRLDYLIKYAAPASTILRYFLFKAPQLTTQAAPVAALASALLSLGLLARHREILALKACGVSIWQIARPLLLSALLLSAGAWGWNEVVVPYSYHQSRQINTVEIKKRKTKTLFDEKGFWYHGEDVFYHIDHFDARNNVLSGLTIYMLDDHFQVQSLAEASRAYWQGGQWHLEGLQEKPLSLDAPSAVRSADSLLKETPEDFALVAMEADEFSSQQLRAYIADLQRKGLDTTAYQVDLRLKEAVPVAILAMTLLGIALAVPGARQLSLPTALGFALVAGFGYWILLALTMSLGHSGALPPSLAAWSANGVSFLLGVFFLLGVD